MNPRSALDLTTWRLVYNAGSTTINPYEVAQVSGATIHPAGDVAIQVKQPDGTAGVTFCVCGPWSIPVGSYGRMSFDNWVLAAYDSSATPAVGDLWGPKSGQGTLTKGGTITNWQVQVAGIVDATNKILVGQVVPNDPTIIGKLAETLSQGGSATVNIWAGAGGSEAATGATVTASDWLMKSGATAIASGKKVVCKLINGNWYVVEAECP